MIRVPFRAMLGALALALLPGCPSEYGFFVRVSTISGERPIAGQVFEIAQSGIGYGEPVSAQLVTVPNAEVTCDGCDQLPKRGDSGRFSIIAGTHYSSPHPVTVHVRAPGYKPVDAVVPVLPTDSQVGYGTMTVVLEREASVSK